MENYEEELKRLNENIWDYSELKFDEHKSSNEIVSLLKNNGFDIQNNLADMDTAFVATFGIKGPTIGFLAEYDALSGLSQEAGLDYKKIRPQTDNGHGCGHNLLGTGSVGAALYLKDYILQNNLKAKVKLIGCPAEEGGSGKAYLARAGIFDDLDIALTWHPAGGNGVITGSMQANCQVYFRYHGKSSHAAASPHLGRSAYDAVELLNVGTNYLREHIQDFDRIHYAVTNTGGISPNVIPSFAEVIYLIRSIDNEHVEKLYERVCNIARGAALMTETKVDIVFDKACSNIVSNSILEEVLYNTMLETKLPEYDEKELDLPKKIKPQIDDESIKGDISILGRPLDIVKDSFAKMKENVIGGFVVEHKHSEKTINGSSDVGDCSHVVPTAQITAACYVPGTPLHSWLAVTQGKTPTALKAALYAAKVLYKTAVKLIEDPEIIKKAKEEFVLKTGGKKYKCPIPDEVKPNQNKKD